MSVSQLADKANLADSTIYEFTGGRKKNIPIAIWRALFELTEDPAIVDLVIGDVETFVVPMPKTTTNDTSKETMGRLIEKRRKDIECEMAILDILADGRITKDDRKAIEQYRDAHPEAIKLDAQIYYTIMEKYEEAVNKK